MRWIWVWCAETSKGEGEVWIRWRQFSLMSPVWKQTLTGLKEAKSWMLDFSHFMSVKYITTDFKLGQCAAQSLDIKIHKPKTIIYTKINKHLILNHFI